MLNVNFVFVFLHASAKIEQCSLSVSLNRLINAYEVKNDMAKTLNATPDWVTKVKGQLKESEEAIMKVKEHIKKLSLSNDDEVSFYSSNKSIVFKIKQ